jgi:DNA polymerase-3 subunit epsilon
LRRGRSALREGALGYSQARPAGPRTPWRDAGYCVVDLELSGLDGGHGEIVSFGALAVEHGRVRLGAAVAGLVAPTRPLAHEAIRVHGIRAADLAHAPALAEALDPLFRAMAGRVLVAHHAPVERAFLGAALASMGLRLRGPVIDTAVLARVWLAERDGVLPARMSLSGLARACGLPVHSPHTATGDALTTAQLFIAVATALDARSSQTVGGLARANERLTNLEAYWPRGAGRPHTGDRP